MDSSLCTNIANIDSSALETSANVVAPLPFKGACSES